MKLNHYFASTPKGLELLLVDELKQFGAVTAAEKLAGVEFSGSLEVAYRACLGSRLANRILLPLKKFSARDAEQLYQGAKKIDWSLHLNADQTLAVQVVSTNSKLAHTMFCAQKVKDAIVDQFRDRYGKRPNVVKLQPDIAVHVVIRNDQVTISLDLSGDSLHKRGYRLSAGAAPIKENLAAAILIRAGYPAIAKAGGSLVDPMCGSGTFLIEGAMMAANIAPGLGRQYFGFLGWKQHNPELWAALIEAAQLTKTAGLKSLPYIVGYDQNREAIKQSFENIERAGLSGHVHVEKKALANLVRLPKAAPGLVIVNPPYGERLGEVEELEPLYRSLGERFKTQFDGWQAAVFTGNPDLGKIMGVRAYRYYPLYNGKIPCKLLKFDLQSKYYIDY